jgi:PAS domain-containing protein
MIFLNPAAPNPFQLDLPDANSFLPDDFLRLCRTANESVVLPSSREVNIEDRTFEETISYSQEYHSIRIYAIDITSRKQTERLLEENRLELKHVHDLLEAVTKGTDVLIAAIDPNLFYTYFNEAYKEEVKRLSGKDIHIGMSMVDTYAHLPDQQKIVIEEWSQVFRRQHKQGFEI